MTNNFHNGVHCSSKITGDNKPTRIESLDIIRGFALLGILLMNIQSFSMPAPAYLNPTAFGDFSGVNFYSWLFTHILVDMKMMNIFSMLFGAGILIYCNRIEQTAQSSLGLHFKRNSWLLVFGLIHAHFFWYGDILYSYALCGLIAYWLRHFSAKRLIGCSLLFLTIGSSYFLILGVSLPFLPEESMRELSLIWQPDIAHLNNEINAYQGDYLEQLKFRHQEAIKMETDGFVSIFLWRNLALICLGMALFKWQILSAARTTEFYLKLAACCLLPGFAMVAFGAYQNTRHDFNLSFSFFFGSQFNYWGSILISIGYIALICLWIDSKQLKNFQGYLANIGKMALSNYLLHSLIFTTIFYGHGLGLFSQVERITLMAMVLGMWLFQFWFSNRWLSIFRMGPLEWVWRSLTYGKIQSLNRLTKWE